jgi:lysophospholipase L1-like esterase
MNYFNIFTSNTLAGSGNQCFFTSDGNTASRCRIFYKIFCGGEYEYSFLISNIIDSTFEDGSVSYKNLVIGEWNILSACVGVTDYCGCDDFNEPDEMIPITFNGNMSRTVKAGEVFTTDSVIIEADKDEYLCIEIEYSGKQIPKHEESIISSFVYENDKWVPSKDHPYLSMVGCNRDVKAHICFLGDSITQGIGTTFNSYRHWSSVVAEKLGDAYSYWNIGLGYARADDAASDGIWLYKAKQNDIVFVCMGVNDLGRGFTADQIKENLNKIVTSLKASGCKVILQTIPPFDYQGEKIAKWYEVNGYIMSELSSKVDYLFDSVKILKKNDDEPHLTRYGEHPNDEGCRIWGEAIAEELLKNKIL